jgi:hypothetical protein
MAKSKLPQIVDHGDGRFSVRIAPGVTLGWSMQPCEHGMHYAVAIETTPEPAAGFHVVGDGQAVGFCLPRRH